MVSLRYSMGYEADITIYPPEGKTWDDVYDIQLAVKANNGGKSYNFGIHIPLSAMWLPKEAIHRLEWFEISMPQPYIESKFTLVVWLADEKIKLNVHKVNNETNDEKFRHKFTDVYRVECSLKNN